jgi:hypothetical protein
LTMVEADVLLEALQRVSGTRHFRSSSDVRAIVRPSCQEAECKCSTGVSQTISLLLRYCNFYCENQLLWLLKLPSKSSYLVFVDTKIHFRIHFQQRLWVFEYCF